MSTTTQQTAREGRIVRLDNGMFMTVLRFDFDRDLESWSWHATIAVQGNIPDDPEHPSCWDEDAVLRALGDVLPFAGAGNGGAGQPFADEPWVQYFGRPVRTMQISQRGGLDV